MLIIHMNLLTCLFIWRVGRLQPMREDVNEFPLLISCHHATGDPFIWSNYYLPIRLLNPKKFGQNIILIINIILFLRIVFLF